MDQFQLLGELATRLHGEFRTIFYLMLPVFFAAALVISWGRTPQGGPDFVEALKRACVATLLLVGFPEISDIILTVTREIAERVSDMSGLEAVMKMAADKSQAYTMSVHSVLQGFNDLIIAVLTFLSYVLLYVARYVMVALYHFSWIFLTLLSPFLLLFHLFSPRMTANLFRSLVEIASWRVVWSILSAILTSLPFGDAYSSPDTNYLTIVVMNFVVALCMAGTPVIVHGLVGSGFSGAASALGPAVMGTMMAGPAKAGTAVSMGREAVTTAQRHATRAVSRISAFGSTAKQKIYSQARSRSGGGDA